MSDAKWRLRILHATNALLTLALIVTGFLITYPDLRAQLIGGYALHITKLHRSSALLYLGIPIVIVATAPLVIGCNIGWRVWAADRSKWQQVNLRCYFLAVIAVVLSGTLMWLDMQSSPTSMDAMAAIHRVSSWIIVVSIPLHLITIVGRIVVGADGVVRKRPHGVEVRGRGRGRWMALLTNSAFTPATRRRACNTPALWHSPRSC